MSSPITTRADRGGVLRYTAGTFVRPLATLALLLLAGPGWAGLISWDALRTVAAKAELTYVTNGPLCGGLWFPPCQHATTTDGPYQQTRWGGGLWSASEQASASAAIFPLQESASASATQLSDVSASGGHLSGWAVGNVDASNSGSYGASSIAVEFVIDEPYSYAFVLEGDSWFWTNTNDPFVWTATPSGHQASGVLDASGYHYFEVYLAPMYMQGSEPYGITLDFAPVAAQSTVPEPNTLFLLSAGLVALLIVCRRH